MKVLIDDGFSLGRVGGIGRYTACVLDAMRARQDSVRVSQAHHGALVGLRPLPLRRAAYWAWLNSGYARHASRGGFDIVHFTNYAVPSRRKGRVRYAVSIHDMVPFLHAGTKSGPYSSYLRRAITTAVRSAGCVFALTEAARAEIVGILGVDSAVVHVCAVGSVLNTGVVQPPRIAAGADGSAPYLLTVGTIEHRKNVDSLVRAMPAVWARYPELQLRIVGREGIGSTRVREAIAAVDPGRSRIKVSTACDDSALEALYSRASAFVFPSLYEGLGIPLLEAMAAGTPVVASRIPSTLEIAGDAAVIVDSHPEALAQGVLQVLGSSDLREALCRKGFARAAEFTPERTAEALVRGYTALLNA